MIIHAKDGRLTKAYGIYLKVDRAVIDKVEAAQAREYHPVVVELDGECYEFTYDEFFSLLGMEWNKQ